jgi:catechol 2,3-dioxygenase-like lactoylglutathione lyase family enzyme
VLSQAKLVAFLATTDAKRALAFYRDTLGLKVLEESPFALVLHGGGDAGGVTIRVQKVEKAVVPPYTALGWEVPDIAATVVQLAAAGVACERFPGMTQTELGIWKSPGGAQVAWFKDPEGFLLSVTQP